MSNVSIIIIRSRESLGINQAELARRVGTSRQTVSDWESGRHQPKPKIRPRLAAALGIPNDALEPSINPMLQPVEIDAIDTAIHWIEWAGIKNMDSASALGSRVLSKLIGFTVTDSSMEPEVTIGDVIVFSRDMSPYPGCMVIAKLHDGETVLRFYRARGQAIDLVPDNDKFRVETSNSATPATILGVVTEHRRKFRQP